MKILKAQWLAEHGNFCDTGIEEFLIPALTTAIGSGAAEVAAPIITDVGLGAAGGAGLGALTGEGAGKGALGGALTGGTIGAAGPVLGTIAGDVGVPAGIAPIAGDIAAGAAGGALGGAATGQPIGTSALGGAAAGTVAGLGAPAATPAPGAGTVPAAGAGGGTSPLSASLPGGPPPGFTLPGAGGPTDPGVMGVPGSIGTFGDATANQVYVGTSNLGGYIPGTSSAPNAGLVASDVAAETSGGLSPAQAGNINSVLPQTGTSTGIDSIISKLGANPGILASAGLLGIEAMRQNKPLPEQATLNQLGAQTAAQGAQLSSYLSTGTLPPGANEAINLATSSAKAQVRSTAASLGLSGSTWESDKLGQIDQQAAAQGEQVATQLLNAGANYTQLSTGIFENLLKETLAQDQAFSSALGNFAGGLAGARLQPTMTAA